MNRSTRFDAAGPLASRRGPLRRFLETRGLVGGHRATHRQISLRADDGTRLHAVYLPGPRTPAPAVLLLHGFAAHARKPSYALLADGLTAWTHVLSLDLRGHGRSTGVSTLGDEEVHDVAAGVRWLRAAGHRWIAVVGVSMGGTAAYHALSDGVHADALVSISAPAQVQPDHDSLPLQRLRAVWHSPARRWALRVLLNVRTVPPERWSAPPDPVVAARRVRVPVLVVHGEDDAYFPPDHGAELAASAAGPAQLWHEPHGFGHAEDGLVPPFVDRLGRALTFAHDTGSFPPREDGAATGPGSRDRRP